MAHDNPSSSNADQSQAGGGAAADASSDARPLGTNSAAERAAETDAFGHTRSQHRDALMGTNEKTDLPAEVGPDFSVEGRAANRPVGDFVGAVGQALATDPGGAAAGEGVNFATQPFGESASEFFSELGLPVVAALIEPLQNEGISYAKSHLNESISHAKSYVRALSASAAIFLDSTEGSNQMPFDRPESAIVSVEPSDTTTHEAAAGVDTSVGNGWLDGGIQSDIAGQAVTFADDEYTVPTKGETDSTFAEFVDVTDDTPTVLTDPPPTL